MADKHALSLAVGVVILVLSIWLNWGSGTWVSICQLLQGIAVSIIIMALFEEGTTTLAGFFIKGFLVSCVITSIIWFVTWGIATVYFSFLFGLWLFIYSLAYVILPRALLPVAISIVVYGITRTKLRSWEILLSSWYVSVFVVHAAYDVWWLVFVQPYLHDFYSSGAGAIALEIFLTLLAFLIAGAFSIVYLLFRKPLSKNQNGPGAQSFL